MAGVVQMLEGGDRHFAVVGAGPSGLYSVERFLKADGAVRVDIFDRDPTPFGLVRYGVAPDHQSTKGIVRVFDRALSDPRVRFFGGVDVGRDLTLSELGLAYDAVLLATGAYCDKRLNIPGEHLENVVGSGDLVAWINRRLNATESPVDLGGVRNVVLIGLGNVAIDIARLLLKHGDDFSGSDLCPDVEAALASAQLQSVTIAGRGGVEDSRFGQFELQEILRLEGIVLDVIPEVLPEEQGVTARLLRSTSQSKEGGRRLAFRFGVTPVAIDGSNRVERIHFDRSGERLTLPADLVVTCIGSRTEGVEDLPCSSVAIENCDGLVRPGLYVTGWAGKGAQGTIPAARAGAHQVVAKILEETGAGGAKAEVIPELLSSRGIDFFDRTAWLAIDEEERARARSGRVRQKLVDLKTMQNVAGKPTEIGSWR